MAEPALKTMSLDEFLDWEEQQERRHELVDGRPVMMTGGTVAHDFVRSRISTSLGVQLRGRPCRVALDVKIACPSGNVRYPDVAIHCGPLRPKDRLASGPRVVIEVLSDSTKATDFLIKVKDYKSVPDIETYLIFWQDEARVIVHNRLGDAWSDGAVVEGLSETITLDEVSVTLSLHDIYAELLA
jgi:Uma2 family endonuclease